MKRHVCRFCGREFEYCRGCLLLPISYKGAGFCSQKCFDDAQKLKDAQTESAGVVLNDKGIDTTSENE